MSPGILASVTPDPMHNRLLATLPAPERERLLPRLEPVPLTIGQAVHAGDDGDVWFPSDSVIALLHDEAEISVVGNEGLVGISLSVGGAPALTQAIVQSPGHAYRADGRMLREEFGDAQALQYSILRYTQALLVQMTQTAACNWHHPRHQRLARWLLLSLDRAPSNRLVMSQDLIAAILGFEAAELQEAAAKLQRLGAIAFTRGQVTVLNRPQLERLCCECYATVRGASDRLLPPARHHKLRTFV